MKKLLLVSCLILLSGCQYLPNRTNEVAQIDTVELPNLKNQEYARVLLDAEQKASPEGRRVLETGREMALIERTVIRGSCWDYANAIFERAGYPYHGSREVVSKSRKGDPLAISFESIQPGDFLSYANHSYNNIGHSAIFVDWLDFDRKIGLMLSYEGQNRKVPARYRAYDLSDVYYVARART